ncbi:melatonin receptor type 1A-like [Styela clava]
MSVSVVETKIYGDYDVPFNGSDGWPANSSIVLTEHHWWIPQFEIPFLIIVILLGIVGNISIIGAILLEKKLKFAGNAFIVNLAVADLVVTSYVLPGVLANVISNKNLFPTALCSFTAVVLSVSCIGSMYSLMFVAINRYVAVVHNNKYTKIFSNKKIAGMIAGLWIWSVIVTIPPAFGWGDYRYHKKIHVCMYDCNAEKFLSFTVSYVCISIILPFLVTCFCYRGVFVAFNENRSNVRSMSETNTTTTTTNVTMDKTKPKTKKLTERQIRERRLVITLLAAVSLFTICWLPYALIILINHHAPAFYKRSAAWLAFTNSSMNSVLYGVLNRNFRNGYKKLWGTLFSCCGCCANLTKKLLSTANISSTNGTTAATKDLSNEKSSAQGYTNLTNISTAMQHTTEIRKTSIE